MIQVKTFTFNPFLENTYVLHDETGECIIIDPGCYEKFEKQALVDFIDENKLKVVKLVNTHCHIDHVLGNAFVKQKYNVGLYMHEKDKEVLKAVSSYASNYGFAAYEPSEADHFIDGGEKVEFGSSALDILFVPGHAPGHIALWSKEDGFCIGGDVLFKQSIGRTDLPGGSFEVLIESIHNQLFKLPDDTIIYPGHGETTTIGYEKVYNPFCAIAK